MILSLFYIEFFQKPMSSSKLLIDQNWWIMNVLWIACDYMMLVYEIMLLVVYYYGGLFMLSWCEGHDLEMEVMNEFTLNYLYGWWNWLCKYVNCLISCSILDVWVDIDS